MIIHSIITMHNSLKSKNTITLNFELKRNRDTKRSYIKALFLVCLPDKALISPILSVLVANYNYITHCIIIIIRIYDLMHIASYVLHIHMYIYKYPNNYNKN